MNKITPLDKFDTETLLEVKDTLESDGGGRLVEMMNMGLNFHMNKIMQTEEGADRNRGRADVYGGFMQLHSQIREELQNRQDKKK